ncbi:MAG: phage scaffolding protein [Ruminococcus sp.]|nr:phage scaffolding protein [Ruminococcus sp.]
MINKEFLEGLGITDEAVVKSITDTYNADLKTEKDSIAAVQKQLDEANTTIKSYTDMDIEGIKKSAADWEEKAKQAEADRATFEHRTKLSQYVKGLHLKDDIYEEHVTKLLEEKGLKFDGDKLIGGDDIVQAFREKHADAFSPNPNEKAAAPTSGRAPEQMSAVEKAFYSKNPDLKPTN